jgi:hypothetical protein
MTEQLAMPERNPRLPYGFYVDQTLAEMSRRGLGGGGTRSLGALRPASIASSTIVLAATPSPTPRSPADQLTNGRCVMGICSKDRVGDVAEFIDGLDRVASGDTTGHRGS